MGQVLYGSICLDKIPESEVRRVKLRNGKEMSYVTLWVNERDAPREVGGGRKMTHVISCAPRRDRRKRGVDYVIGELMVCDFSGKPAAGGGGKPAESSSGGCSPVLGGGIDELPF